MKSVPKIFPTIMNGLNINAESITQSMIKNDIFINILTQSLLPSSNGENRLLADLLQRRVDQQQTSTATPSRGNKDTAVDFLVDIRLLNRLKNGEFIQVLL
jgi:hypothetical protein